MAENANEDEINDLDQENPVDCSQEVWTEIYSKNPDLLDYDDSQ